LRERREERGERGNNIENIIARRDSNSNLIYHKLAFGYGILEKEQILFFFSRFAFSLIIKQTQK
jgi:hypothetical protein